MVGICRQAFMIIVMTLIITTVMIITMVIRELLRFSCGEVAPSGGVKGIGTVALLSNSLPSMLVVARMRMVLIIMVAMMMTIIDSIAISVFCLVFVEFDKCRIRNKSK